jgi:Fic family protein
MLWGIDDKTHDISGIAAKHLTADEVFGIEEKNKATVSRYIREAVNAGMIKPFDEGAARKMMKYVPFWV